MMEEKSVVQTFAELLLPIYQVFIPLRGASIMKQAIKQCSMGHLTCNNLALLNLQTLRCSAKRDAMILASARHVWNSVVCICLFSLPETHYAVTTSVLIDHKDSRKMKSKVI